MAVFGSDDHLGSTRLDGAEWEHMEYSPYGEQWIDEDADRSIIGYRFTSKEYDTETGLYYFGARYMDPTTSRWMSVDPATEKYLPETPTNAAARDRNSNLLGMGGVYNLFDLAVYDYSSNNPVKYVDPNGEIPVDTAAERAVSAQGFEWPLATGGITQAFGPTTPAVPGASAFHHGIDIAAPQGTPIYASKGGTVLEVLPESNSAGLGNAVIMDVGNGYKVVYGHLQSPPPLEKGQKVGLGEVIGKVGSTGKYSTGAHLHFGVYKNGKDVDPTKVLPSEHPGIAIKPGEGVEYDPTKNTHVNQVPPPPPKTTE
jgi:RHS repeat-associated protein